MDTAAFLARHFADLRDDEVIEIRCVFEPKEARPVVQRYFRDPEAAARFALGANAKGYHAYYGANPRHKAAVADDGPRGKGAVSRATHLWVDIDGVTVAAGQARLAPLADLPPQTVVATGGGIQALYHLGHADGTGGDAGEREIEHLLLAMAEFVGGDSHVADLARVLRLPGTVNHKPDYPAGTVATVVEHTETTHPPRFWRGRLKPYLEPAAPVAPPADAPAPPPADAPLDTAEAIDRAEFYDALAAIDPWSVGYDEWLRILMALHAFDPSLEGLTYAVVWAKGKPGEVEAKWRGFKREGSNPATVFHFARQAGWRPTRPTPGLIHDSPATPPSRRQPRPGPSISLTSLADFFNEQDQGPRWLVEQLLNAGGTSLLVAKQKVGKSTFAANLAVSVAAGVPFLGRAVAAGPVHVYSLEVHRAFVRQQYQTLVAAYGLAAPPDIKIHAATGIVAGAFDQIAEQVLRDRPALVVLDTLAKAVDTIKDGNDYLEVYQALRPVIALAEESGAHIVCVHHANKGLAEGADAVMGSVGYAASVDLTMLLRRDREADLRSLTLEARFLPETDPLAFDFDHDRKLVLLGDRDRVLREGAERRILAAIGAVPGMTAAEIKAATGLPDGIAGPAIHKLTQTYRLTAEGSPKRYTVVQYAPGQGAPGPQQQGLLP